MNILFILPEYLPHSGGGISTYYQHYITALKPHVTKIKVIVGSGYVQSDDTFELDGVKVEYLKPILHQKYLKCFSQYDLAPDFKANLASAWAMWEQIQNGDGYDLIECTDFGLGFVPGIIQHQKPIVVRLHGSSGQIALYENSLRNFGVSLYTSTELNLLARCDSLITHSKANQQFWKEIFPNKKIEHFYPIYENLHPPVPFNQRNNVGLVTSRIQKWKGPITVCEALSEMTNPPKIKWIGRDMDFSAQQSTAEYLREHFPTIWKKQVVMEKPMPNAAVVSQQQQAKFGLIPSSWDMFNFTCLEFLSLGTPVVCSDGAGASELIKDGENGFKFKANDKHSLIIALDKANNLDQYTFSRITAAGLEIVQTQLSAATLLPLYLAHYQRLIASFKPTTRNILLEELYQPKDGMHKLDENLDKLPLKRLLYYIVKRISSKIGFFKISNL
ncbi:glycosyltransferase family 4 protein [Pedobacter agri]|uniref:glycosyltransferase family 4 protein n=1 Tax=Pedobacter agri TaxID=454586 RepID=UPI0027D84B89|nr:glycosyltransferase [Pedobacter agri]